MEQPFDRYAIFDTLDAHGYAGRSGCEYEPCPATDDGFRWTRDPEYAFD